MAGAQVSGLTAMKIQVKNFRGVERCVINVAPIALLGGVNGAGKSSICQAVAAALSASTIPFYRSSRPDKPVLTKTLAKALVRGGTKEGGVQITVEGGMVNVHWPSHDINTDGIPPKASKLACGLIVPMDMDDTERQKFLSDLLDCAPSAQDVANACKDVGLPDVADEFKPESKLTAGAALYQAISVQGWDNAHRGAKEKGARLKGAWEAATNTDYGNKKAEGWLPEGWDAALADIPIDAFEEELANARQAVENAVGALAVDTAELTRLAGLANREGELRLQIEQDQPNLVKARQVLADARAKFSAIHIPADMPCPGCGEILEFKAGVLIKAECTSAERKKLLKSKEKAEADATKAHDDLKPLEEAENKLRMEYGAVSHAPKTYAEAKAKAGSQEVLDAARAKSAKLDAQLAAIRKKQQGDAFHKQIVEQQKIIDILAPEGLRRAKLSRALTEFNTKTLAPLCVASEFPAVTVNDQLDVLYGGRPYYLLSESEKFRVRAVMQTGIAKTDGSALVILDGADILDGDGRNGLFGMMDAAEPMKFLVAMTVNSKSKIPVLEDGQGATYWVEGGNVSLMAVEAATA
jgi:hypothetical protein